MKAEKRIITFKVSMEVYIKENDGTSAEVDESFKEVQNEILKEVAKVDYSSGVFMLDDTTITDVKSKKAKI